VRQIILVLTLVLTLGLTLGACGVKNDPDAPKKSDYPRSYPTTQ
jgi:predicted small lipoprotein YifL